MAMNHCARTYVTLGRLELGRISHKDYICVAFPVDFREQQKKNNKKLVKATQMNAISKFL